MKPALTVVAIALVCFLTRAQTPKPTFEVASIKPATPLGPMGMQANRKGGPGTSDPTTYLCENCPLSWVVSKAYDVQPFEFSGPDWLESVRFDFAAKVAPGASKEAFREMLQNLLADRFKLAVHREKKVMEVFELTVSKGGLKIHEAAPKDAIHDDPPPAQMQRDRDGFPILPPGATMAVAPGHARIRSDNQPVGWLARMLSGQLHGPVIDSTGLTGKYDYMLSWAFDERPPASSDGAPTAMADAYRPALIGAVQSQLGLKLEQKKGPAEVLMVDHMEKTPTEN
jgi:uncharacterized protein (TIGR03435 family)